MPRDIEIRPGQSAAFGLQVSPAARGAELCKNVWSDSRDPLKIADTSWDSRHRTFLDCDPGSGRFRCDREAVNFFWSQTANDPRRFACRRVPCGIGFLSLTLRIAAGAGLHF